MDSGCVAPPRKIQADSHLKMEKKNRIENLSCRVIRVIISIFILGGHMSCSISVITIFIVVVQTLVSVLYHIWHISTQCKIAVGP